MYLSVVISQSSAVANGGSVVAAPQRGGQAVVPPSSGGFVERAVLSEVQLEILEHILLIRLEAADSEEQRRSRTFFMKLTICSWFYL